MSIPEREDTGAASGSPTNPAPAVEADEHATTPFVDNAALGSHSPTRIAPAEAPRAGEVSPFPLVPGYALESVLGSGGMGVVYKARDLALKRTVALKMIRTGRLASATEVARFLTEAEAVAQLRHPNILQVYEFSEAGGLPFCALEYADGGSLAAKLAGQPMPPREAAPLLATLAGAVQLAHSRNIIHRDLKPANVLLADGVPKIADFGIARRLDDDSGHTLAGDLVGTPSYMAPEQARGGEEVGPAADVYALGVMLYEFLTGGPPFRGATAEETLEQVRTREPVAPRLLRPGLPRDLETICLKCLHKEPRERYASAAALADDLQRWLVGEAIWARPVGRLERVVKWVRRRPTAAALAAVSVVAAIAVVGLLVVRGVNAELRGFNDQLRAAADEADLQRRRAEEQEDRARRFQYAADLQLVQRLLLDGVHHTADVDRAGELLGRQRPRNGRPDVRGLEWYILWGLCHRERATFLGGPPRLVASGERVLESFFRVLFTADGHGVVVGGADDGVRVWDPQADTLRTVAEGRERFAIDHIDHRGWFTPLPDGRELLVVADDGKAVRLYDLDGKRQSQPVWEAGTAKQAVTAVALSADGKRVALVCLDNVIRLRDLENGKALNDVPVNADRGLAAIAFNPMDANVLAVANSAAGIVLWDIAAGRAAATLTFPADTGLTLAFAPNGQTLVAARIGGTEVSVWDAVGARGTGIAPRQKVPLAAAFNGRLAFAPDGGCLVVAVGNDVAGGLMECLLWDVTAGKERARLTGHGGAVWAMAFTPDGRTLATVGIRDGVIHLWDVATGTERATLVGHTVPVFDLAFRGDGRALASAGGTFGVFDDPFKRAEVKVWDAATWEAPAAVTGGTPWALGPDGRTVAVSDSLFAKNGQRPPSRAVEVYDLATGARRARLEGQHYLGYSPDGKALATAPSSALGANLWDTGNGGRRAAWDMPFGVAAQLLFAPDGRSFIASDLTLRDPAPMARPHSPLKEAAAAVNLLDAEGAREQCRWPGAWGPVQFSADGTLLAAYGEGQTLKLFEVKGGGVRSTIQLPGEKRATPQPFALAPDGRTLAAVGGNPGLFGEQPVTLYDTTTGKERGKLRGDLSQVHCLRFSPDGRTLATGHGDVWLAVGWVKLWDAATGEERLTLGGHRSMVTDLLFTADGTRLLSASATGVKFWDPVIGQEVLTLPGGPDLQLTPDGRTLAVGPGTENNSRVRLWRAEQTK